MKVIFLLALVYIAFVPSLFATEQPLNVVILFANDGGMIRSAVQAIRSCKSQVALGFAVPPALVGIAAMSSKR